MQILNAIIAIIPLISRLLDLFIKTPEEKRRDLIVKLKKAFDNTTMWNTQELEDIINGKIGA